MARKNLEMIDYRKPSMLDERALRLVGMYL